MSSPILFFLIINQQTATIARQFPKDDLTMLASVTGDTFAAIQATVQEVLRQHGIKSSLPRCTRSLLLQETSGHMLALLFAASITLSTIQAIQRLQQGMALMSDEEIGYWFVKCFGADAHHEWGIAAFCILLGTDDLSENHRRKSHVSFVR